MASPAEELTWRVHPAAERTGRALLVAAIVAGLSVLAAVWMDGVYWGLFAAAVLFLSLESFFLPTRFALRAGGVSVQKPFSKMERDWSSFRSAWFDPLGVTLSPFAGRHWLESYRAVRLRYTRAAAAPAATEVRRFVLEHLDPAQVRLTGLGPEEEADARARIAGDAVAPPAGESVR